jgi:hypothetical protein
LAFSKRKEALPPFRLGQWVAGSAAFYMKNPHALRTEVGVSVCGCVSSAFRVSLQRWCLYVCRCCRASHWR